MKVFTICLTTSMSIFIRIESHVKKKNRILLKNMVLHLLTICFYTTYIQKYEPPPPLPQISINYKGLTVKTHVVFGHLKFYCT